MIPDIKVSRSWFTGIQDALKWSDDGVLAAPSRETVTIFSPSASGDTVKSVMKAKESMDDFYEITHTPTLNQPYIFEQDISSIDDITFSLESYNQDLTAIEAAWSPTGQAHNKGCILSVLTTRGEVFFYESKGNFKIPKWEMTNDVLAVMCEEEENGGLGRPKTGASLPQYIIQSMAWSPQFPSESTKWGAVYFAVGTKSGHIRIMELKNGTLELLHHLEIPGRWITKLKWSSSIESSKDERVSFLFAGLDDNSIYAFPISFDIKSQILNANHAPILVQPPSRFSLSSFSSLYHADVQKLIFAFSLGLSVVCIALDMKDLTQIVDLSTRILRSELCSLPRPISALGVSEKNEKSIYLLGFADSDKSLLATIDLDADDGSLVVKKIEGPQNSIGSYIEDRLTAGEFLGTTFSQDVASEKKYQFQCFGMAVSPLGDYIAFLHSIVPDGQLRYPILSNLKYRVSFMVISDHAERLVPEKLAVAYPATRYSPISVWWKIQAVCNNLKSKERAAYIEAISEQFYKKSFVEIEAPKPEDDGDDGKSQKTLEQRIVKSLFESSIIDNYRLYCHYKMGIDSYPRLVLDALSVTVLMYLVADESSIIVTTLDKAILLSYCQALLTSPNKVDHELYQTTATSCLTKFGFGINGNANGDGNTSSSTVLEIPGEGFEESFDFVPGSRTDDVYTIKSQRGYSWRRCSTTLLPLTQYNGKTCSGCGRPIISVADLPEDQVGWLLSAIFRAADVCIYCGCRFIKN